MENKTRHHRSFSYAITLTSVGHRLSTKSYFWFPHTGYHYPIIIFCLNPLPLLWIKRKRNTWMIPIVFMVVVCMTSDGGRSQMTHIFCWSNDWLTGIVLNIICQAQVTDDQGRKKKGIIAMASTHNIWPNMPISRPNADNGNIFRILNSKAWDLIWSPTDSSSWIFYNLSPFLYLTFITIFSSLILKM